MTLAIFERKASCIDELEFNNRVDFLKRYGTKIKVEKEIILPQAEYNAFINDFYSEYSFITENKKLMYIDKDGVWHCILVRSKENPHMILVQSEGYDYARYAAIYQPEQHDRRKNHV